MSLKRKRKNYDVEFKLKVVEFAKRSSNRAAERTFGVSEKMVRDWRAKEQKLNSASSSKLKKLRIVEPPYNDLEKKLSVWVSELRSNGSVVTRQNIRSHALQLAKEFGHSEFKASEGWCSRFLYRQKLTSHSPQLTQTAQTSLSETNIQGRVVERIIIDFRKGNDFKLPGNTPESSRDMSESEDSPTPAKVAKLSSSADVEEVSSDPELGAVYADTQKALEDIDNCQNDIDVLNEKASEEILQIEMKYNKLRRPHFEKRNNLIQHIPNFWVTSFLNHPRMANIVEEEEEECLHYLKQVDVEEFEDVKSGFTIKFQFATNPYFSDSVLTKELRLTTIDGNQASSAVHIHWNPNMNLTKGAHGRHARRRGSGRTFFSWLTENIDPSRDKVAEMIKDDLWPNPLQYYLASAIEVEENSNPSDEDSHMIEDDSVVIVGDDDDSDVDDDVYEVRDDDDDDDVIESGEDQFESGEELEETVESIEVEDDDDDDDDDAIEVLGSDSEAELLQSQEETSEISNDPETSEISHQPDTSQLTSEETDAAQDDSVVTGVDTADNSVSEMVNKSETHEVNGDVGNGVLENAKSVSDIDDKLLNQSQTEGSNVEDGNESDLLKEDDDDDVTDLAENKLAKKKNSEKTAASESVGTKEGVD